MAFGFFKKNEIADAIFMNGKIFTQNTDLPWAEAVACKDGLVLAVGDYEDLVEFEGKDTDIVDLEGGVMLPGYIDTCGHPVLTAFKDSCLFLENGDLEYTLEQIADYASKNKDSGIIFAYGYDENILKDLKPDQTRVFLDEIRSDKPIVVLGKSGFHCWINTNALETVKAAAEEDEVDAVSIQYLLSVLAPIDFDIAPESLPVSIGKYCERGFTSVFDCGAPDFFASIYQNIMVHMFQENMIKQRFFGSLLITSDVNPAAVMRKLQQCKTNCVELNEYVNFNTLKLVVDRTPEAHSITNKVLRELCLEAGDKGFDVHIDAIGKEAVFESIEALEATRTAGYKKSSFTIAHDKAFEAEELINTSFRQDIKESVSTLGTSDNPWLCIENVTSIEEAIDMLTIDAAIQLGINNSFGSIEKGKHADFVIFNENPFESEDLSAFKKLQSVMTVIDGEIVYDVENSNMSEWYSLLTTQQDS